MEVSEADTCNVERTIVLKNNAEEVSLGLDGKNIFLVGMMGCGKTTVGKILSEALGYSFFDSDELIERTAGGTHVAQIFKEKNEEYFRDAKSKVLSELSSMHHRVVATGGGAVVRPQNWRYLKQGVTVWLDVPLEALAKRVTAVGTESRPLLGQVSVDPYSQAFVRLAELIERRGEAYANSDVKVSLQSIFLYCLITFHFELKHISYFLTRPKSHQSSELYNQEQIFHSDTNAEIATELGFEDVSALTATTIATEVWKEMGNFLRCKL